MLDRLLIHISPTDLLVAIDWIVIHKIIDPEKGNGLKFQLTLFANFDAESLPFVAISGNETLNILNMKTYKMQALVSEKTICYRGQSVMFSRKEHTGYSFHFASSNVDEQNNWFNNWFRISLEKDFFECLRDIGRLPPVTTREYLKEIRDAQEKQKQLDIKTRESEYYKRQNEQMKKKFEDLNSK